MKYYYDSFKGESKKITKKTALELLGSTRLEEGIQAKQADQYEEVSYMVAGGFVRIEF